MQKKGIQNFICSFILSMLAIVSADKFVLHSPQNIFKNPEPKYIEAPNVSLFSEPSKISPKPQGKTFESVLISTNEAQTPVSETSGKAVQTFDNLLPPPPKNNSLELSSAHAIVLEDDLPTESNIVYEGEPDNAEVIPLEQGELVTHQNVQSADFAALTPYTLLSEPVYHSNLVEDTDQSLAAKTKALEEKTSDADTPWVMASANKYAKNQMAVESFALPEPEVEPEVGELSAEDLAQVEDAFKPKLLQKPDESSQTAYKMIQNLLIPIPEDIMNDADLTPELSYSPHEKKIESTPQAPDPEDTEEADEEEDSGLIKSIASWFSKKEKKAEEKADEDSATALVQPPKQKQQRRNGQIVLPPATESGNAIMPAELRLSFQPNRAEISGQSLQWIRAFADNARDHDDVFLEVRIDTTGSINLQKKRLKLLSKIFADRGVDFRKINVIATAREPNSLIIRNIRFKQERPSEPVDESFATRARTYY